MQNSIPSLKLSFTSLLRADLITQWRNRKSILISTLMVPTIILTTFKDLESKMGGAFIISTCIVMGLIGIGLMGYSISLARDRDKGVFQRLRVAPISATLIMVSRLTVQLAMILILVIFTFVGALYFDNIHLSAAGYLMGGLASIIGGAVFLSLGQAIVGLIVNPETVNSVTRLLYIAFIMTGMFGDSGGFGPEFNKYIRYTPYGSVKCVLAAGLEPGSWNSNTTMGLLATLAYIVVFAFVGIKWFKWSTR